MRSRKLVFALMLAIGLVASSAHAAVITFNSRAAFAAAFPGATVEDWDSFAANTVFPDGTTVNGIAYHTSAGDAMVTDTVATTTPPNGLGAFNTGFFEAGETITFTLDTPTNAFGIDINTLAGNAGDFTATTDVGDVISSAFNPFPGSSLGQFIGFSSNVPFSSVTIAAPGGFDYSLDTLRRVAVVPEPATLVLVGAGLFAASLRRRTTARR